jgi:hypothetical protein
VLHRGGIANNSFAGVGPYYLKTTVVGRTGTAMEAVMTVILNAVNSVSTVSCNICPVHNYLQRRHSVLIISQTHAACINTPPAVHCHKRQEPVQCSGYYTAAQPALQYRHPTFHALKYHHCTPVCGSG